MPELNVPDFQNPQTQAPPRFDQFIADKSINTQGVKSSNTWGAKRPGHVHQGRDFSGAMNSDVGAADDGEVVFAGPNGNMGNAVKVKHADGTVSVYGHLNKIGVKQGDQVKAGSSIGLLGQTGNAKDPHVHFELYQNGLPIDPAGTKYRPQIGSQTPTVPRFDEFTQQAATPETVSTPPRFDEFIKQPSLSNATAGMQGQQPKEKVSVEAKPAEFEGETPQIPTEKPLSRAAPIDFQQGATKPASLNPVENIYDIASGGQSLPRGVAGLQARKYEFTPSQQLGNPVSLPLPKESEPSEDDVVNAYLGTLGSQYVELGKQYKEHTGHNILTLGGGALKLNDQGQYYIRPTKGAVDFINAYARSEGDAAAEANRQADEHIAAINKAYEAAKPDVAEAKTAMSNVGDNPLVRKMFEKTSGAAQAFGSVVPGSLGNEFERQAAVEKAAGEQLDKEKPFTTTRERILGGIGGLVPTAAMLLATHRLGPAQLAALGILEGSTPEERLRGGMQGATAQTVLGGAPAAFTAAGLPITGKAVTSAAMVGQPAVEAWQRGESPTQAITENLPFAALPFLHGKGRTEKPTELGIDRAPISGVQGRGALDADQVLAQREAAVKPVTDSQGNVLLNADEIARDPNAKPKIKLANQPTNEPAHPSHFQPRTEEGKFDGAPEYPEEFKPENVAVKSVADLGLSPEERAQREQPNTIVPSTDTGWLKASADEAWTRLQAARGTDNERQLSKEWGQADRAAESAEARDYFAAGGKYIDATERARILHKDTPIEEYAANKNATRLSAARDRADRQPVVSQTPVEAAASESTEGQPRRGVKEQISYQAKRQQVIDALARDEFPYKGWDKEFPDLAAQRRTAPQPIKTKSSETNAPKEPEFVTRARERLASREAHVAQGGEFRGSGGPDTQPLLDSLIIKGWELYDQTIKPTFEEWARKLREEFGPKAEEHLRGVWAKVSNAQPSEESATAAMKATVDEDRATRGAEPLPWKPETKADEDLLSEANRRVLANPREAQQLTAEVLKNPRALSDVETVQLDVHKQELVNDHNQILKEIAETDDPAKLTQQSARLDAIEQEFDDTDRAWRLSGTEKGRSLRAQRITINQNYELLPMKARMKAATGEARLPPEVEAKIEAQQKRIAELENRWNKRVAAKEEKARTESVDKVIIEKRIEIRRAGRRRTREALVAERADLKQQVAQAWAKMKPKTTTLSMGGLGDLDPNGELTRALSSLARNYIEDGVIKAADLVDTIHEQIKDVADLTKRQVSDLISGYGRTKEPTRDPVETKFNEIKSILASTSGTADVLEKGTRPLRRGQQREKPTEDQRRALRELENAMREKGPELAKQPYDITTEQATPLDKAKTTARNRQEQLQKWIADGKREVQGRQQVIPDAELNRLKAENAALEKVVALLNDPAADQKAIERRMSELQKMIIKQRSNIQSGKVSPDVKEGAKSTWSPEISAMEKERRALMGVANDMRADAARKAKVAEAAKPIGAYGVEGTWADFEARAKKALAARKRFEKQIADMQQRRATGNFEKEPKAEPLVHDPDTEQLRLEMNREKRKFDADVFNAKIKKEWSERPLWSKGMAYGAAGVRAGVLSGVKTLGKIGSALAQRTGQQYAEEGLARVTKPFVRGTAEKATRYGGHMNVESEKAFARGFGAGVKEIPDIIRTGESELSRRFSDRYPGIPTKIGRALEVPGRFHFAEKNPLMRGEFERYKELALQEAERKNPGARNNPAVIDEIEERAYKSAKEVILMGDNPFSRMITDAQRRLSLEQRDMVRTIVPVHRVAGNYLNQAINEYGLGIFRGAIRAIHERNPDALAKLTPEEADKTMRLIQRGTLGVIYMALAGTGIGGTVGVKFGGFYKRGRKDEVKPQDIKVGKVTIPHWVLHSPPDELAQLTASMKQEWDEGKQREETRGQRFASGAARSIKGVMSQTPFVNELTQITNSLDSGDSLAGWAGRFVASRVEPQIVQEIARTTDKYEGQDVKRKPRGFTDALKMGLPGARQTVPISPVFGSQASKASNEVQRLDMALNGVVKKPDESRQEFAERQPLVNGYIRRALEKEVTKSDYQNDSDPNKVERIKQVKEAAEKEGQAAYDATPHPQKLKKQKQVYPVPSGKPLSMWLPPRNPFKRGSEAFKA